MNIVDLKIKLGGGPIAGPQGLGIWVGNNPLVCPSGWIFVDLNNLPPNTNDVLIQLSKARKEWPAREKISKHGDIISEEV